MTLVYGVTCVFLWNIFEISSVYRLKPRGHGAPQTMSSLSHSRNGSYSGDVGAYAGRSGRNNPWLSLARLASGTLAFPSVFCCGSSRNRLPSTGRGTTHTGGTWTMCRKSFHRSSARRGYAHSWRASMWRPVSVTPFTTTARRPDSMCSPPKSFRTRFATLSRTSKTLSDDRPTVQKG